MKTSENTPLTGPLYRDRPKSRVRRIAVVGAAAGALALVLGGLFVARLRGGLTRQAGAAAPARPTTPKVRAPAGERVRVEVVNTTQTRGLARRATQLLRDAGFDVVGVGTTTPALDSTRVIDRSGHPEWAHLVAKALGGATVETQIDTSRYLDVTVLLGGTFRPPAEPFYP